MCVCVCVWGGGEYKYLVVELGLLLYNLNNVLVTEGGLPGIPARALTLAAASAVTSIGCGSGTLTAVT